MTILDQLQPILATLSALVADVLTAHGIPASYAPLALILCGLLGLVMVLSMVSSGNDGALRPSPPPRGSGATPRDTHALRSKGAGTPRGDTTTPRAGARRMEGGAEGEHWLPIPTATVEQADGKEPRPRRWLLPDLVPYGPLPRWRGQWQWPFLRREVRGYITALVGMAGTAKSYLLLAFAIAALTEQPWCGLTVNRVKRMLYVDCELDSETFVRRAYEVARGFGLKKPPKGLHYLCLTGISLAEAEGWWQVERAKRRCKAEGICVDSITIGSFTVTVNDAGAMNRLFGSFELWGVPVFAIDHLGKNPAKGAVGSFMKYAKIRSELTLQAVRRGLIQFTHSKTNFGAQLDPFQVVVSFVGGKDGVPLTVSFAAVLPTDSVTPPAPGASPVRSVPPVAVGELPGASVKQPTPIVTHSPTPLALPVLTPPAAPADTTDTTSSPILAWLALQPDTTPAIPSRVIYAAMAPQGVTLRACKMQLKTLTEQGRLERTGSAQKGYLYWLAGRQPLEREEPPCQAAG